MLNKMKKHRFLFEELVKRDFKKKYKRTVLGMLWSMLAPLLTLLAMAMVFTQFFGNSTPHFIIYMFAGNLIFSYYREATNGGMNALVSNSTIFSKVNVPKYMFLLSKNISSLINFGLTLVIFFLFVAIEGIPFTWKFLMLIYPIVCLLVFNIGLGLILSALYIIFKDVQYLYDVFTTLLMYFSAIFYTVNAYAPDIQSLFYLNPIYVYITYFRKIVIENTIPTYSFHLLAAFYSLMVLFIGGIIYKKYNYKFLYYV
ncbi:ABC-type polysaccharide/polyol phosphate export systems, permease component [Desulfitobacterium dichloroeliminans LMG P-21439]|uniref:Transport permease protein n=1 Tax=Desulfitobacterium dichloroeliminans (strain LMG P-21439 / DCA1) TaxID=871963 RepID=L0F9U7_DESDL|nr:ABC transporter permease [Desulfitobacterium dichloroeliminans]AGA70579.1 ABC-type polysaccharide/polyol phosphate export systems, permease component [Desulfitobacterium dichloroeliminans LMG P-21439]